jgi:hypothetical protein
VLPNPLLGVEERHLTPSTAGKLKYGECVHYFSQSALLQVRE